MDKHAAPHPIVKSIVDQGCQSYWVACPLTREALLVDPKIGRRDTYARAAAAFALKPVAVVDTHTHADHLSDSIHFEREGLTLYMSRRTGCQRRLTRVGEGDEIAVGGLRLRVLEVPGHTGDSIALAGGGLVLTGDSLLVGSLGRTDFRGSDAATLFESVATRLMALDDSTVVLPGHGYRDVPFSTIGVERRSNPALAAGDARAYAAKVADVEGRGNSPDVDFMLATNVAAEPSLPESGSAVVACCDGGAATPLGRPRESTPDEVAARRERLVAERAWIDVRDPSEFAASHVPGAINLPLSELGFHLDELRGKRELLLQCQGGVRSLTAARALTYLGVHGDPISLAGGFQAWAGAGLPVARR
jgi:sulfur dioxygenase